MHPGEFAVMNRDWRYIRYGEDGEELYNLKADPNEWDNLAGDPAFESEKAKLRSVAPDMYLLSRSKISMHARALSLKVTHSVGNEVRGITYHGRKIAPTRIAAMTNH